MVASCTISTTSANETLAPVHHRMPVILSPDAFDPWLAGQPVALDPYPADAMTVQPVSPRVNKASNDDSQCVDLAVAPQVMPNLYICHRFGLGR